MIIGVTGNNEVGMQISEYLNNKYSFRYLNVDQILKSILEQDDYYEKFQSSDYETKVSNLIEVRNKVDDEVRRIIASLGENDVLVVNYSTLEDSYVFGQCDLVIKANSNNYASCLDNEMSVLQKYRINSLDSTYNESLYHLQLDETDIDWKDKLRDFIDYNVFNDKKVTVVVPIYNTSNYLSRCVDSITNQTYRNLEIILIDDGSTDDSLQMCNLLAETDKRIKVVHQQNCGLAETRNRGIDLATGQYICFFDSDDYIENSMIETLLRTAEKTNADVCESSFYIHMKNGDIKDVSCEQKGVKLVEEHLDLINAYSDATILIPAWDKLYKLSSIKNIRFDKNCFKEDSDYIYKLCREDKSFALVNTPFYHYVKRKSVSLTGNKISPQLFTLQDWGKEKYEEVLSQGEEYRDAAEKILYNSLVHIIRNYMRDHKDGILEKNEFKDELQGVTNDLISLLLTAKDVKKFRKLDEVLSIVNTLVEDEILEKDKMPSIELPCVGILWNSLDENMMKEAIGFIEEKAVIKECIPVDLKDKYSEFIGAIYEDNHEFEGIPYIKASTLIDKYDSNTIVVLNMLVKVSNYMYFNKMKGFMFEEVAELKSFIRKYYKNKITNYAYDNIFHLTVDNDEFKYTDEVCKKYVKEYKGVQNGKNQ